MKKLLNITERGFTVLSLLLFSGGPLVLLLSGGVSQGDGREELSSSSLIQLIFLSIYVVTFFLLIKRWKQVLNLLVKEKFILLLVGIAFISCLWSYAPELTLRRSIALIGTTLFGVYLATRYSMRQQLRLLAWTFGIAILLSFLFALALPGYGIMGGIHVGTWRGIYVHKNILGKIMVLSAIVFLILAIDNRKDRFFLGSGYSLSLALLVLSTSKTAHIICVILLSALGIYWAWRQRYDVIIIAFLAVAVVSGSLFGVMTDYLDISPSVAIVNTRPESPNASPGAAKAKSPSSKLPNASPGAAKAKSPSSKSRQDSIENLQTLTGRTQMWSQVLDVAQKQLLLGYGYGVFWDLLDSKFSDLWVKKWKPAHAHNGLLDVWIDLGLVGVLTFLIGFLISLYRAIAWIRLVKTSERLWPLLYLTYLVLFNLTASTLLDYNNIFWVLYVAVVISVLMLPQLSYSQDRQGSMSAYVK